MFKEEIQKRKKLKTWWVVGGFIILFIIIVASNGCGRSSSNPTTGNQNKPTTTDTSTTPAPIIPAPTWHQVIAFQGSSTKNTETFHISSNEWRINWNTTPSQYGDSNFIITIMDSNNAPMGGVANVIGEGNDTNYEHGAGDYSLQILSGQSYQITIEEKS